MFSGIVEALGRVNDISRRGGVTLLKVKTDNSFSDVKAGESVSVNGACLTAIKNEGGVLSFEVMAETLKGTNLGTIKMQEALNLERPLKVGDRVSGHFVLGHIDCVGIIRRKVNQAGSLSLEVVVPAGFMKYVLAKGSIAADGISLTIADKKSDTFRVSIIPHTLKNTTLGLKGPGDKVNIEFDILAKK